MTEAIIFGLSFLATLFVWWRLVRWEEHLALRLALALIALFPVIGPLLCLWVIGMPGRADPNLRATMNHYGIGGRFIGFGSKRFMPDEVSSDKGEDWNPSIPERQRSEEKKLGR